MTKKTTKNKIKSMITVNIMTFMGEVAVVVTTMKPKTMMTMTMKDTIIMVQKN